MCASMKISVKLLCLVITTACCLVSISKCEKTEKLNILAVFLHPGKSHFDFFRPLLEELARRGHSLTVVSYFPSKEKIPNYKDIVLVDSSGVFVNVIDVKKLDHSVARPLFEISLIAHFAKLSCRTSLEKPAVQKLINSNEKFDLILTELFNSDCFLGFVHKFKAPYIGLSSHAIMPWGYDRFNSPDSPSYVPSIFTFASTKMNFFQRVQNTLYSIFLKTYYQIFCVPSDQALVEEFFGPGVPPLSQIANNISALLVNTHFSLHGSRPYSQGIVEVGGLHIGKTKALPNNLQTFLDSSKEGVLYFSLGSMVRTTTLPKQQLDIILRVLGSLKHDVVWKWEDEDLPNKPKNVMVQKWLPQFDILSHPKVKGFLTHAGLLGLSEGIYVGVPMVIVPLFGDQFINAAAAAHRGAAIILEYENITESSLSYVLNEILNNPSYRNNARAVSEAYRDRPASALDTAVWWCEYVARGKGQPFLRSDGANLSWYQYHLLDVIAFLSLVVLALLFAALFSIKLLLKTVRGKKVEKIPKAKAKAKANAVVRNGSDKKRV